MPRIARLVTLAATVGGAAWIMDVRRRAAGLGLAPEAVALRDVRGFVTHRFNPLVMALGLAGGPRSAWAILEHTGRTTGRVYHAPILPLEHEDHVYVRLTYGEDVHWVSNVRAAGHCRMQHRELIWDLDEPVVVGGQGAPFLPGWARPFLANRHYLRMHVLDVAPGTFAHPRETVEAAPPAGEPLAIVHPPRPSLEDEITAS